MPAWTGAAGIVVGFVVMTMLALWAMDERKTQAIIRDSQQWVDRPAGVNVGGSSAIGPVVRNNQFWASEAQADAVLAEDQRKADLDEAYQRQREDATQAYLHSGIISPDEVRAMRFGVMGQPQLDQDQIDKFRAEFDKLQASGELDRARVRFVPYHSQTHQYVADDQIIGQETPLPVNCRYCGSENDRASTECGKCGAGDWRPR